MEVVTGAPVLLPILRSAPAPRSRPGTTGDCLGSSPSLGWKTTCSDGGRAAAAWAVRPTRFESGRGPAERDKEREGPPGAVLNAADLLHEEARLRRLFRRTQDFS